jgi:hypothetical protein
MLQAVAQRFVFESFRFQISERTRYPEFFHDFPRFRRVFDGSVSQTGPLHPFQFTVYYIRSFDAVCTTLLAESLSKY